MEGDRSKDKWILLMSGLIVLNTLDDLLFYEIDGQLPSRVVIWEDYSPRLCSESFRHVWWRLQLQCIVGLLVSGLESNGRVSRHMKQYAMRRRREWQALTKSFRHTEESLA